jgi:AraC-like DNA-binding protein
VPLKTSDREAFREATLICQRELEHLTNDESTSSRVRRLLLGEHDGFPSLQVTARLLHVTPRTLHRRLLDEGTSFRALLEEVRHALAIEHVRSGRLSIQEIAFRLGYSDVANFRRAFKRWEEAPPTAFKARAAAPVPAAQRRAERRER